MGNGKKLKCNDCGAEWLQLNGIGFDGVKSPSSDQKLCPKCGSSNIQVDPECKILWD